MTNKQIESSREARLWVTNVILPVIGITGYVLHKNPDLANEAKEKFNETKRKITNFFKKQGGQING